MRTRHMAHAHTSPAFFLLLAREISRTHPAFHPAFFPASLPRFLPRFLPHFLPLEIPRLHLPEQLRGFLHVIIIA